MTVAQFNLLACNAIVSSGESKKSHGSKSCEYKVCCRISITLLLARNSHTKQEWVGGMPWWRNLSPSSTFQVEFTIRASCKFIMHNFISQEAMTRLRANLSYLLQMETRGPSTEMTRAWFLGHVYTPTSHQLLLSSKGVLSIDCYYLQKGFCISSKPPLKVLAHAGMIISFSSLSRWDTYLVAAQHTFRQSFKML